MTFKEFCSVDDFTYEGIHITINEIPLEEHEEIMLEQADQSLINFITARVNRFATDVVNYLKTSYEPPLKKYRVTLRYPRSRHKAYLGHYQPDTLFVYATSAQDAKKRAIDHVRNKLEPIENDETRRFLRYNYLKNIKRKHLDINAKRVRNWDDFLKILKHVAINRGDLTPLDYFDEQDFQILLNKAKQKDFTKVLAKLSIKEQRLLKRMYFHMAQSPWLSEETKKMLDGSLTKTIRGLGKVKDEDITFNPAEFENKKSDWNYWSVFEPKNKREEQGLLDSIHTVKDAYEVARHFGISAKDLREHAKKFDSEDEWIDRQRHLYRHLRKTIKISPRNNIFDSDWANPLLVKKYGIRWDDMTQSLLNSNEEAFPFVDPKDPNNNKIPDEAAQWLWDFYKRGMPKKPVKAKRFKQILQDLLDYRDKVLTRNR